MATKKKSKAKKSRPRSGRLPGMEQSSIPELERVAEQLNDVRSNRIALSKEEGELADSLLLLMKKHNKHEYHHEEVHVWRKVTEEKVKVKIGELDSKKEKQVKAEASESAEAAGTDAEQNAEETAAALQDSLNSEDFDEEETSEEEFDKEEVNEQP